MGLQNGRRDAEGEGGGMILTIKEMCDRLEQHLLESVKDVPEENKQRVMVSILDSFNRGMGGPGVSGPEEDKE